MLLNFWDLTGSGIRYQEFKIMNNLLSWNLILLGFMHDFSSYEHLLRLGPYPILKVTSLGMFQVQTHFCKTKGSRNTCGTTYFKIQNYPKLNFFEIWYPTLICLYLGSQISNRNVFVLQTELWIPPFKFVPAF